ncbi:MAG: FIST N-terminal domain-containing protein [Thermodesulfobacteriota bacterium]
MTGIGVGVSTLKNPSRAGKEAACRALDMVTDPSRCCLVFATAGYPQRSLLDAIRDQVGPIPMAGCSGEGIIGPGVADESNHAVLVAAIADPRISFKTAGYPTVSNSRAAARHVGISLSRHVTEQARFALLFPGGLHVVADEFLTELEAHLPPDLPCLGGAAGENWQRQTTYQYHDWQIYDEGVSAALVSGDFRLATSVSHGCVPIGTELEISRVEGNRLYELGGRPVMDVMAEYVGEDIWSDFGKVAVHFCLGQALKSDLADAYDPLIIRFIPQCHPEDKSVSLPVRMTKGERVWMTRRDHRKMFESAKNSIDGLRDELRGAIPFLALHFDCAGRGKVVLSEADKLELIASFQKGWGQGTPWAGFFTYGEFCPIAGRNMFHNYTAAIALLY